jgi:ribosomal protein S27AE
MRLRMKCPKCGYWNRIEANKLFIEQETSEPKVKAYIPMYKPLKTENCKKCGQIIAEPKELIRIVKRGKIGGTSG